MFFRIPFEESKTNQIRVLWPMYYQMKTRADFYIVLGSKWCGKHIRARDARKKIRRSAVITMQHNRSDKWLEGQSSPFARSLDSSNFFL